MRCQVVHSLKEGLGEWVKEEYIKMEQHGDMLVITSIAGAGTLFEGLILFEARNWRFRCGEVEAFGEGNTEQLQDAMLRKMNRNKPEVICIFANDAGKDVGESETLETIKELAISSLRAEGIPENCGRNGHGTGEERAGGEDAGNRRGHADERVY